MTRSFSSHSPNRNVVQNLYTGKYAEPLTGLAQMDARWYDAQKGRFIQGDQYNHANLMLPKGAQSELMRYIGRTQGDLLRDPAQQMRYGYVSGNALRWVDPLGLSEVNPWDHLYLSPNVNDATRSTEGDTSIDVGAVVTGVGIVSGNPALIAGGMYMMADGVTENETGHTIAGQITYSITGNDDITDVVEVGELVVGGLKSIDDIILFGLNTAKSTDDVIDFGLSIYGGVSSASGLNDKVIETYWNQLDEFGTCPANQF